MIKVHECINCGAELEKLEDLANGCPKCGSKYFKLVALSPKNNKEKEEDIKDSANDSSNNDSTITENNQNPNEENKTNVSDNLLTDDSEETKKDIEEFKKENIESVLVKQKGIYEVNLEHLLEDDSLVFADEKGNYVVDINSLLNKKDKTKNKKK